MRLAEETWREAGASSSSSMEILVSRLAEKLGATARATTIFAPPVERDGVTVIPVAQARWGFGGGGGRKAEEDSGGGGGGARVSPVGFIEMRDGRAKFRRIRSSALPMAIVGGVAALLLLRAISRW